MRLFLGIEIDEAVRSAAAGVARLLAERLADTVPALDARWIAASNLHITLWFLGEVSDAQAPAVRAVLDRRFQTAPFVVEIGGAGAFPSATRPKVFWLGVRRGRDELAALHEEIAGRLTPLGFAPEARPYMPHLTLARVKHAGGGSGRAVATIVNGVAAECGTFEVTAVTLFRSRLSPRGAAYEPLQRVPLT